MPKPSRPKPAKQPQHFVLPDPPPMFLTKPEVCALLRVSYTTIWQSMKDGRFPVPVGVAPGSRCNRWVTVEVLAAIEQIKATRRQRPGDGNHGRAEGRRKAA